MLLLLGLSINPSFSQTENIPFYNEWYGNNCDYKTEKPFSFITDVIEFHNFWKKSGIKNDAEPSLNFDKYMIFLWNPGKSLYDWSETQIDKFQRKEGAYLVLIDFKRKYTGKSTKPFYAVIMPKLDENDFFIFKKKLNKKNEIEWQPFYTLWNMTKSRNNRPFNIVLADKEIPAQYNTTITSQSSAGFPETQSQSLNTATNETINQQKHSQARIQTAYVPPATTTKSESKPIREQPIYSPSLPEPEMPKTSSKPVENKVTSSIRATPSKPNYPTQSTSTVSKPASPLGDPLPAMDEDPLFGSEFDITF